ncbi:macrolide family glycosyltransferase [Deinococcus koreensis]|uniref:macrolide family glycosyltransferase n=1 Tax=Deinococcus koreensis TaxID=2054903 RepID=UPI0013FE16FA|nr:macrolide family glycosyltransferase [Deinococcus koreensis]
MFFNVPAHGHINPTLPVVAALVERGAQVEYHATPPFRPAIEGAGAQFTDLSPWLPADASPPDPNHIRLADMLLRATETILEALLPRLLAAPPDVIVHDSLCPWGAALARLSGVRAVGSVTTFVLSAGLVLGTPALAGEAWRTLAGSGPARRAFRSVAGRLRQRYGLHIRSPLQVLSVHAPVNVVYTSRTLQPAGHRVPPTFHFVGPSLPPQRPARAASAGPPLIYVSLGTLLNAAPDFYRACVGAFRDEPVEVIMSVGQTVDPSSLGPLPGHISVRPSVPQLEVLSRAGVFVTHGGMNSVHEALAYGVPMLLVPQGSDQHLVAARVRDRGAGRVLQRRAATAEDVRAHVRALWSDPRYAAASAAAGQEALHLGGAVRAAEVILARSLGALAAP